jgi:hypothetical protein
VSRGPSGRIVVEVEPQLKRGLYAELSRNGLTLKDWLIAQATSYIREGQQQTLFPSERPGERGGGA